MFDLKKYGHDMTPYTPAKLVEVGGNSTETLTFQGPSSAAFGITRVILSAQTPRDIKVTVEAASGDTTHWKDVIAKAVQQYFAGHSLPVPLLLPRSEKAKVTLENTTAGAEKVGVQLEGLHGEPLKQRKRELGLSEDHSELSFFYGTSSVPNGASLVDLGVNYVKRKKRAFDRFAVAADADKPHDLRARLVEANSAIRLLSTFDQIRRSFADGRRAPTPYKTEPYGAFSVEVTNEDSSTHDVSFLAASLPPSFYEA